MKLIRELAQWRELRAQLDGSIGLVATMGALHAGHTSLIDASVAGNEVTVLTIFVNPTQFNQPGDLQAYPRTFDADIALAQRHQVDYVLAPDYQQLYPDRFRYRVEENEVSGLLCGADRPGHFTGVLTVVMKLLNLVQPTRAYFGQKDYQQLQLIRDMCQAFFLAPEIVACPIVRERDGLAMSSRNQRLDSVGRALAAQFNQLLRASGSDRTISDRLRAVGFAVDYVVSRDGRRFGAVRVGNSGNQVRLIDNVELAPELVAESGR